MAPNKKKKKPASNPARGFATTSTASKPKHDDAKELEGDVQLDVPHGHDVPTTAEGSTREEISSSREHEKALHELTPEELESQLEDSGLQILVESHGEKTKKDVSRQVSRLQTEKRLLRSQAEHLGVRQWLPPEIMQIITNLLKIQEYGNGYVQASFDNDITAPDFSEDDLLVKLWALKRLLPLLGFTAQRTDLALRHLLRMTNKAGSQSLSSGRDSMWGLDECLAWLALDSEPADLPRFDVHEEHSHCSADQQRSKVIASTPATTPTDSRPESPLIKEHPPQESQTPNEDGSLSSAGDSDSDAEPEHLVTRYLELQSRLYEVCPELTEIDARRQRRGRSKRPIINGHLDSAAKRRAEHLMAKIQKIKSDLLFDEDKADSRWAEIRIDLAQEAAERKRLGIGHDGEQQKSTPNVPSGVNLAESNHGDDDAEDILGGFFTSLPDTATDPDTGLSIMSVASQEGSDIEVRDFGKWTGLSPRRVLEEACKARDSASRVTYKLVSASSFSNRYLVEVKWSRLQEPMIAISADQLNCQSDARSSKIEMVSISCPTEAQAEAYISTVAMFMIFASSPKEEKVHLRLPSTWRDLWKELSQLKKDQDEAADRQVLRELRSIIAEHGQGDRNLDEQSDSITSKTLNKEPTAANRHKWQEDSLSSPTVWSEDVKALWASKLSSPSYQHMLTSRTRLPIWNFKNELLDAIKDNQVIIICGETGCGKSTQVPAFILEHELSAGRPCKIYCTEPRRISAISLARRVSEELGERKSDVGTFRSLVGFAIRLESKITPQTKLVYATTGIIMRMLEGSDDLGDITHLVLDEIHERSIDSDFLLIVLRKLLERRSDLKVVLMSATVNAERFSDYLGGAPVMNVPGRTFPVDTRYLEDAVEVTNFNTDSGSHGGAEAVEIDDDDVAKVPSQVGDLQGYSPKTLTTLAKLDEYRVSYGLIVRLLETIATSESYSPYSKAILVFLPGMAEIRRLNDMLAGHRTFINRWYIYALHSTIATDEQERAFLVPPPGIRKIVLATNIAETGITIPDITCVIDTGKHKEMRFDERRQLSRLIESFISRANAKQRRGRAGRVQKGLCFHLFTKNRHDNIMPGEQTPEMLRLSLQDLVLRVKICKLGGIEQTLSEALDPPSTKNIRRAIDSLVDVKALTAAEDLTPLGRQLAKLPLDVFLGKLILLGAIFGCLDAMLTIAAILSSKSPFSVPMGTISQADVARQAFRKGDSDLLTVYNAYCAWRRVCGGSTAMSEQQFCQRNFMSQQTLSNIEDTKSQLTAALADAGFVTLNEAEKSSLNKVRYWSRKRSFVELPDRYGNNNNNDLILNSVIAWSFYPKLLRREGKGWKNIANNQTVSLHPTSVNKGVERPPQWLSFYHIMQSSNKFYNAHETSPVESFAVALVCGEAEFKMYSGCLVVDGNRIRFALDEWKTFLTLKTLRVQIRRIMAQAFRSPGRGLSAQQQAWLDVWQQIFSAPEAGSVGSSVI